MDYGGEFVVKGVDERKAVLKYEEEMGRAKKFGTDIVEGRI